MKKYLFALTLLLPLLLGGCSSDDQSDDNNSPLIGSWISIDDDVEIFYLDLKKDGTGKWTGKCTKAHLECNRNHLPCQI